MQIIEYFEFICDKETKIETFNARNFQFHRDSEGMFAFSNLRKTMNHRKWFTSSSFQTDHSLYNLYCIESISQSTKF